MDATNGSGERGDLSRVERFFSDLFRVNELDADLAFSRFVPMVYDPVGFPWRDVFEPDFVRRFNGLMNRGREHAGSEYLVMQELAPFFARELGILAEAVPESHWWR